MDTSKLPPETRCLWARLEHNPLLTGFVLIGGTALAMRIGHRVSEDLDFAYLGYLLPTIRLRQLVRFLDDGGVPLRLNQDLVAEHEFINSGLLLEDHQQNYVANDGVKVSFVRLDNPTTGLLHGGAESPLRVATLDEIFKTKALVCAERSKSRDWFDLYILMTRHGYDAMDLHRAFAEADSPHNFGTAAQRLRACIPNQADEGYLQLVEPAPSLEDMRKYFAGALDQLESDLSAIAFKAKGAARRAD